MEDISIRNLIRFGLYNETLKDADKIIVQPHDFDLHALEYEGCIKQFELYKNKQLAEEITVNFADSDEVTRFYRKLRSYLPVVEIVDLIDNALSCGDRILIDKTEDPDYICTDIAIKSFKQYDCDYIELSNAGVFVFAFAGDNREYRIKFKNENIRTFDGVEYASRASRFVDMLIARVMNRYNVLQVNEASMVSGSEKTLDEDPVIAPEFEVVSSHIDESDRSTDKILSQLKVLISYSDYDTINNSTFTETVIDDVYLTFPDGYASTPQINDVIDIAPKDDDVSANYETVELPPEEFAMINAIIKYVESTQFKLDCFGSLRRNENSQLFKLLNKRKRDVYLKYKNKAERPKIDFTMTPLTVYSNHITQKTKQVTLKYKRSDIAGVGDWTFEYDPMAHSELYYRQKVRSETGEETDCRIDENNPLVLAVTDDFVSDDGNAVARSVGLVGTCLADAVKLTDINDYYRTHSAYKDVYILKSDVIDIDGRRYFVKECHECVIEGRLKHKSTLRKVNPRYIKVDGEFLTRERDADDVWVSDEHTYKCGCCGKVWAGDSESLASIKGEVINSSKIKSCCPECKNTIIGDKRPYQAIYRDVSGKYFIDDAENPKQVDYCSACESEFSERGDSTYKNFNFIYVEEGKEDRRTCAICGGRFCNKHLHKRDHGGKDGKKLRICTLCLPENFSKMDTFDSVDGKRIFSKIRFAMLPRVRANGCAYSLRGDELRVYATDKNGDISKIYYFLSKGNKFILKKSFKVTDHE